MTYRLLFKAIAAFSLGLVIVSALLFLPAWTLVYWRAWLLIAILFLPMFVAGIILYITNPDLLKKRLCTKEKYGEQDRIIKFSGLMFAVGFVCASLDFRFKWTVLPDWVSVVAVILFLLGYLLYAVVIKQNEYLSRTITVEKGQKVIDTGLYSIIRHPMYSATVLLFLSMPLVLGSLVSFAVFLVYPFIIAARLKHEEKVLEKELAGYSEYKKRVKCKLIPFIW